MCQSSPVAGALCQVIAGVLLLGDTERTEVDAAERCEVDVTERTEVDVTEWTELGETERTEVDGAERCEVDVTERTEVDVTERTEVDDTERTEVDVTEGTEVDVTERTEQLGDTERTEFDGAERCEVNVTERTEVDVITERTEVDDFAWFCKVFLCGTVLITDYDVLMIGRPVLMPSTLLILPLAGFLCSRQDILGGWPAIFYLSALIGIGILFAWLLMSADKPSKHFCTSNRERSFVEEKIAEERLGKRTERRKIPWRRLATCRPLYIGVAALICHEYPLVIMLQLLPKYINDVLLLSNTANGFVSALPIAVLFLSKTFSSSISSFIQANKKGRFQIGRTALAKWFNGIASLGLGICVGIVPLLHTDQQRVNAIVVLCLANAFAGLHTPGVQIALLQIAPAYTGIITGIAFGCVAIFSIVNKILSNFIVQSGSLSEWTIVFWIAAVIALLPVFFFTLWGSAERQHWASTGSTIRRTNIKRKSTKRENNFGKVFPMEEIKKEENENKSEQNTSSVFYINKIDKEINSDNLKTTKTTTFQQNNIKEIKIKEIDEEEENDFIDELNINFDSESLNSVLRLQMFLENIVENEDENIEKIVIKQQNNNNEKQIVVAIA
uniref:MFS domain-containing protein n=1 Tax=Meloidogyne hapla TaxID=6305 RepID=A0A1I8B5I3_MELHA